MVLFRMQAGSRTLFRSFSLQLSLWCSLLACSILLAIPVSVHAETIEIVACVVNPFAEYARLNTSDLIVTNASRTTGDNYLAHWEAVRVWERLVQNRSTTTGHNFNVTYLFLSGDPWQWNSQLQNYISLRNSSLPKVWLLPAANYFAGILGETLRSYPVLSLAPFVYSRGSLRCPASSSNVCIPGTRRASNLFSTRFSIDDVLRLIEEWASTSGVRTIAYLAPSADDFSQLFLTGLVQRGSLRNPQITLVLNMTQPLNISLDAVVANLAALNPDFIYYMWSADMYEILRRAEQIGWYPKGIYVGSGGVPSIPVSRVGWVVSGDTQYLNRSTWNDPMYFPTTSRTNTSMSQYSSAPIRLLSSNKTMGGVGYQVVAHLSILHQVVNRVGANISNILAEYQNASTPFQTILGPVLFDDMGVVDLFRSGGRYIAQYVTQTTAVPVYPPAVAEALTTWPVPGPCKPPSPLGFDFCNNVTRRWYSNTLVVGNSTIQAGLSVPVEVRGNLTFSGGASVSVVGNAGEIIVTGCVEIDGGTLQLEIEANRVGADGSTSVTVLTSSSDCLSGRFGNITAFVSDSGNGTCYQAFVNPQYSTRTLSVAVSVVQSQCPLEVSKGGLLAWQLAVSIVAPIVACVLLVVVVLSIPPCRRKIFPGRDFFAAVNRDRAKR